MGAALGLAGMLGMFFIVGPNASVYTASTLSFDSVSNYSLIIVPIYVAMGILASDSGLSADAYECLRIWLGRVRGSLGIATLGACTLFGTMCGSSIVTAAVFAKISAPEMRKMGYSKKAAYGICTAGGIIGMLIPPSVLIVVYGILSRDSIGRLLIGGIVPGLMLTLFFSLGVIILSYMKSGGIPSTITAPKTTWREKFISLKMIWGVLATFAIVVGGLMSGAYSPSEAGSVATLLLLIIFIFKKRKFGPAEKLKKALLDTVAISAMIFLILIGAGLFSRLMVLSTVAPTVLNLVTDWGLSPIMFLFIVCIGYTVMGCFFDSISMLSITLPILQPAALALGISPLHFAMVVILIINIGVITPPVGLNVYGVKGVAEPDVTLEDLFASVIPFFLLSLLALFLLIFFPVLSEFLPALIMD